MNTFGKVVMTVGAYTAIKIYGKVKYLQGAFDLSKEMTKIADKRHQKVNYTRIYGDDYEHWKSNRNPSKKYAQTKTQPDYIRGYDYIFEQRRDAEQVLDDLNTIQIQYGFVTVADYYDLVGATSCPDDNLFGWTSKCWDIQPSGRHDYIISFSDRPKKVG